MAEKSFEDLTTQEKVKGLFDLAIEGSQALVGILGSTGIAGFKFDISDDEEITLENDITDHYTENNVPVQDNIVNKPVKVTLRGLVGEYVYTPPQKKSGWDKVMDKVQDTAEKLVTITSYLPAISDFTQQAFDFLGNKEKSFGDVIDLGTNAFELYRNINIPSDKQSSAFLFFEALWRSRQTFTIQTPYRFYTDMAIQTLKAVQSGYTRDNTDFEITFKQINKVTVNERGDTDTEEQGRLKDMASNYVNKGIASVKDKASGAWDTFTGWFGSETAEIAE